MEYRVFYDNGHDDGDFEFFSEYKEGTEELLQDAKRHYKKTHGNRTVQITDIYPIED